MNRKLKLLFILIFIALISKYYGEDYNYETNYEIIDDDAFAKYKDGMVYIGDEDYLDNLKNIKENDILICDDTNCCDPNFIIYDSYKINDKNTRNDILNILYEYEKEYPSDWYRTIESMRLEWLIHNYSYYLDHKKENSKDVDLNNCDEEKYNIKILRKILKI